MKLYVHVCSVLAIAEGHKTKGDEEFRKQEYNSAIDFYTQGLQVKCKDDELNAKLYSDRATAHYLSGMCLKHKLFDRLISHAAIQHWLIVVFCRLKLCH